MLYNYVHSVFSQMSAEMIYSRSARATSLHYQEKISGTAPLISIVFTHFNEARLYRIESKVTGQGVARSLRPNFQSHFEVLDSRFCQSK